MFNNKIYRIMKTTGILTAIFIFLFSLNMSAQIKSGIIATFDAKKTVIQQDNNQTVFKIKATEQQIKDIKATSLKFAKWSTTTVSDTKDTEGNYTCTIKFIEKQKDNQFLLKLLFDFNIESFLYDGTNHEIKKFDKIVK